MAITQDTTALALDRQAGPDDDGPKKPDASHDWRTCTDHKDCIVRGRRWRNKQQMKASGQMFKENSQYMKDLEAQIRRLAMRIAEGGNVEDLAQLRQLAQVVEATTSDAIAALQATNPPRRDGSGASWQRVAEVLGVKKQSAWEKYRKVVDKGDAGA